MEEAENGVKRTTKPMNNKYANARRKNGTIEILMKTSENKSGTTQRFRGKATSEGEEKAATESEEKVKENKM